jgi:hypothetical protein
MGYSSGGLWVQILLDRGLGAAGVTIDSAPTSCRTPGDLRQHPTEMRK